MIDPVTVIAVLVGPVAALCGVALAHWLSERAARRRYEKEAADARLAETRRAIRQFLRVHSETVAIFRKLALLIEVQARREETLAQLDKLRQLRVDMDLALAEIEWVAPAPIVLAARKASEGAEPAMREFDKVVAGQLPTESEWNAADRVWADARRVFMTACRREFYGDDAPPSDGQ